jgi:hypothetical protein
MKNYFRNGLMVQRLRIYKCKYDRIEANRHEQSRTSKRGELFCNELNMDWRLGAAYFESTHRL